MAFKWTFMNSDHLEVKHKISILCTTDNNIHSKKNCLIMNVLWITMHYYICQSWYGKLRNYATPAISRQLQIFVTFVINKHSFFNQRWSSFDFCPSKLTLASGRQAENYSLYTFFIQGSTSWIGCTQFGCFWSW